MRKTTSTMTLDELARAVAEHQGWQGREGGWIYDQDGRRIVQGYLGLGRALAALGVVREGVGIAWRDQQGRERDWAGVARKARSIGNENRQRARAGRPAMRQVSGW